MERDTGGDKNTQYASSEYILQTRSPAQVGEHAAEEEFPPVDEDYAFHVEDETPPKEAPKKVDDLRRHLQIKETMLDELKEGFIAQPNDYLCVTARTALILPFNWDTSIQDPNVTEENPPEDEASLQPSFWVDILLGRHLLDERTGETYPMWQVKERLPAEIAELSPVFQRLVGYQHTRNSSDTTLWRCWRLELTQRAHQMLFSSPKIWAIQEIPHVDGPPAEEGKPEQKCRHCQLGRFEKIARSLRITSVDIVLYAMAIGLLMFQIDWLPENTEPRKDPKPPAPTRTRRRYKLDEDEMKDAPPKIKQFITLHEMRTWLFLCKFRHKVKNVFEGWTFGSESQSPSATSQRADTARTPMADHLKCLGKRLGSAIYDMRPMSLSALGNWLLLLPGENPDSPPSRISHGQYAHHHTTIVVDRAPSEDDLRVYLFHLRRAFGQRNRPPPPPPASSPTLAVQGFGQLDRVLVHRLNRYIGISREGTVCLSWPTDQHNFFFEQTVLPKLFQGIYLVLAAHVLGERVILLELSRRAALQAEALEFGPNASLSEIEECRLRLRDIATLMVRYTLSMCSDDCGGFSEYAHFFSSMRELFGVPGLRAEIREELDDVLGIVESGYHEEQRKLKIAERREEHARRLYKKKAAREKLKKKKRFDVLVSLIATTVTPFVLVGGAFGMNVAGIPDIDFWPLIAITGGVTLILPFFLLLFYKLASIEANWRKKRRKRRKAMIARIDSEEELESRLDSEQIPTPSTERRSLLTSEHPNYSGTSRRFPR